MKFVSGIRPSGFIHIGNYLGAIKQWKRLINEGNDCLFFVADLHGRHSHEDVLHTMKVLGRLGVNPVLQSSYKNELLSLAHELSFEIPVGWLNRMTQFKDKAQTEDATLALFSYPCLMTADIIYHKGTHVPVGSDQVQHIEFTRDVCRKLGLPLPEAVIGDYPRIMSLTNPLNKMSKSDPDDYSRINVCDGKDRIVEKLRLAKTSNHIGDDTPAANNLRGIYKAFGGQKVHTKWSEFKDELTELICNEFSV